MTVAAVQQLADATQMLPEQAKAVATSIQQVCLPASMSASVGCFSLAAEAIKIV